MTVTKTLLKGVQIPIISDNLVCRISEISCEYTSGYPPDKILF